MTKRLIEVRTADGVCPAGLFGGKSATGAVVIYMDAFGPRKALDDMAERIAAAGHAVLVPDLYYRQGPYEELNAATAFKEEATATKIRGFMAATTQGMTQADTGAFLDVLAAETGASRFGTVGYCMGGARALNAATAHPGRIVAAASFHGGNLASDAPDSPHRNAGTIKARAYVGCAGVDRSFPPEQSAILAEALRTAEVDHIIENYVGMQHGWCVPDHGAFDAAGAERHWKRLLTLFDETLRG